MFSKYRHVWMESFCLSGEDLLQLCSYQCLLFTRCVWYKIWQAYSWILRRPLFWPLPEKSRIIYKDDYADITGPSGRKIRTWEKWVKLSDGASLKYRNWKFVKGKIGHEIKLLQSIRRVQQSQIKKWKLLLLSVRNLLWTSVSFLFFSLHF